MPWASPKFPASLFEVVRRVLADSLPDLFQRARHYEPVMFLPYGTTVRPSAARRQIQNITVTDGSAFTVANPSVPREGIELTLDFLNQSDGTMGAVTFGDEYSLDGAFDAPGVDEHAVYTFVWSSI